GPAPVAVEPGEAARRRATHAPEPAARPRIMAGQTGGGLSPVSVEQRPEIEDLYGEGQSFPPAPACAAQANATADLYAEAHRDPEAFWAKIARERISWSKPFD